MPLSPCKPKPSGSARDLWWPILVLATAFVATQAVSIIELVAAH